jgi:hypothetical protein
MSRLPSLGPLGAAALTLASLWVFNVLSGAQAAAAAMLAGGAYVILAFARHAAAGASERSPFEAALERPATPARRPPDLAHLELDMGVSLRDETRLRARIAPLVREIADARTVVGAKPIPDEVHAFLDGPDAGTLPALRRALDALERG